MILLIYLWERKKLVRLFYSHFLDAYVLPILTIFTKFINLNKGPILKEESHIEYKTYINLLSTLQVVAPRNPQKYSMLYLGGYWPFDFFCYAFLELWPKNWFFLGYVISYGFLVTFLHGIKVDQFFLLHTPKSTINIFAVIFYMSMLEALYFSWVTSTTLSYLWLHVCKFSLSWRPQSTTKPPT